MQKNLVAACAALAALAAFVVPPAASASPVPTENGTALAVGSSITLKNTGNIFFTGATTLACEVADLQGTVTTETSAVFEVQVPVGGSSFTGTGSGGDCTSSLAPFRVIVTSKLCFQDRPSDGLIALGCGPNVRFTLEFTGFGTCKYSTASLSGTLATGADATFNFSKQPYKKTEGGAFCPSEGQLDMDLDLTTTDGTTLLIS